MQRQLTLTILAGLAFSLAGCDMIGEKLAEQAAEQVTGTEIDVDEDGVSVEAEDGSGSFRADEEGFSMETDEGTFDSQVGQVPEDFPSAVPLPDAAVVNGSRMDTADGMAWMVNFQYDSGDPGEVLTEQAQALEDAGFTTDGESQFNMGDSSGGMAGALYENDQYRVNVSVLGETDDFVLGYQVFEIPPDEQQ